MSSSTHLNACTADSPTRNPEARFSVGGIGLLANEPFAVNERVKIDVRNNVPKFHKHVHGTVRWSQATADGKFRIGVALNVWFTPGEIELLKRIGLRIASREKIWV